jgi:hypothetical protein
MEWTRGGAGSAIHGASAREMAEAPRKIQEAKTGILRDTLLHVEIPWAGYFARMLGRYKAWKERESEALKAFGEGRTGGHEGNVKTGKTNEIGSQTHRIVCSSPSDGSSYSTSSENDNNDNINMTHVTLPLLEPPTLPEWGKAYSEVTRGRRKTKRGSRKTTRKEGVTPKKDVSNSQPASEGDERDESGSSTIRTRIQTPCDQLILYTGLRALRAGASRRATTTELNTQLGRDKEASKAAASLRRNLKHTKTTQEELERLGTDLFYGHHLKPVQLREREKTRTSQEKRLSVYEHMASVWREEIPKIKKLAFLDFVFTRKDDFAEFFSDELRELVLDAQQKSSGESGRSAAQVDNKKWSNSLNYLPLDYEKYKETIKLLREGNLEKKKFLDFQPQLKQSLFRLYMSVSRGELYLHAWLGKLLKWKNSSFNEQTKRQTVVAESNSSCVWDSILVHHHWQHYDILAGTSEQHRATTSPEVGGNPKLYKASSDEATTSPPDAAPNDDRTTRTFVALRKVFTDDLPSTSNPTKLNQRNSSSTDDPKAKPTKSLKIFVYDTPFSLEFLQASQLQFWASDVYFHQFIKHSDHHRTFAAGIDRNSRYLSTSTTFEGDCY